MSLPYFQVDTRNERLKTLTGKHGSLWSEFNSRLDYSWIFHDHGLEGVVLQYSEISSAFNDKQLQDGQTVALHQEIRNLRESIMLLREYTEGKRQKDRYSKSVLTAFYDTLTHKLRGIPDGDGLRQEDGRYGAYYHKCCPHEEVEANLKKIVSELNQTSIDEVHPLVSAARLHYDLMRLMPFGRFSGRVIRLFMNMWLMRHNYPPAIVHTVERARYYEALAWEDESLLLKLLQDAVNNTVESALLFIEEGIKERRRKREARKARKLEMEQQKQALEEKKAQEAK
ncbi:MAG TPA: hypothetical protein DCE42_21820, partial [Myxococcales bacterium]|nr:hypothetical protein [Myxococcales bacterium]